MSATELETGLLYLHHYIVSGDETHRVSFMQKVDEVLQKTRNEEPVHVLTQLLKGIYVKIVSNYSLEVEEHVKHFIECLKESKVLKEADVSVPDIEDLCKELTGCNIYLLKDFVTSENGKLSLNHPVLRSIVKNCPYDSPMKDVIKACEVGIEHIVLALCDIEEKIDGLIKDYNLKREIEQRENPRRRILPLSADDYIRIAISVLFRFGELTPFDLCKKLNIHIKNLDDTIDVLSKVNFIEKTERDSLRLSEIGVFYARAWLGLRSICLEGGKLLPKLQREQIRNKVLEFVKKIEPPNPYLFQWFFTSDSIIRLVECMLENFDIEGRRVACLMSPTVALAVALTGYPIEVWAIDIDGALLKLLENESNGQVKTYKYDVQERTPEVLRDKFDCFVIDPPYKEDWYTISISRALDLIGGRKGKTGYIVVPPDEIAYSKKIGFPPLIATILHDLREYGLTLDQIWKGILNYLTPPFEKAILRRRVSRKEYDSWRTADLLRIKVFRETSSSIPGSSIISEFTSEREIVASISRYNRRFLERQGSNDIAVESHSPSPVIKTKEASEWDKFLKIFLAPSLPENCSVLFHDIGDWEQNGKDRCANRLILIEGTAWKLVWNDIKRKIWDVARQEIKQGEIIGKEFVEITLQNLGKRFKDTPIKSEHIIEFLKKLVELELLPINSLDKSYCKFDKDSKPER